MSAFVENTGPLTLDPEREIVLRPRKAAFTRRAPDTTPVPNSGYSGIEEHSSPLHGFLEHSTTYIFPVVFILNVYLAVTQLHVLNWIWLAALAIPLSLVWGDLVSGLVHWTADTYFSEETPVVGASLVKPFRMHHQYPRDICTHNLVSTVGNVCIIAVPMLAGCLYLLWQWPGSGWLEFAILCITLMSGATVATNQFHKWAHQEDPSPLVRRLQRMRLVLNPDHHQVHHTHPFNVHYCITNGWLNPLLNKIRFFRRLEGSLRLLGVEVNRPGR
ncbi:MAG: fatty acid desaturase CarF family protein [Acidobacteriota bacterium]